MPRQSRQPSGTGIHHVMMRGINHQNIFEDAEDYYQFIITLDRMRIRYDDDGTCGSNCTYYAYCLMSNHFHLLIRERDERVGETVKRIASSYVYYYNRKYGRDGHLFKERFKSEPVNDMAYFTVLLRYIHQNPLKAGIVEKVKDYEYSSWGEYDGSVDPVFQICDTRAVLNRISFNDLEAWMNMTRTCPLSYPLSYPNKKQNQSNLIGIPQPPADAGAKSFSPKGVGCLHRQENILSVRMGFSRKTDISMNTI